MDGSAAFIITALIAAAVVCGSLLVYSRLLRTALAGGGKVDASSLGAPDLIVAAMIGTFLAVPLAGSVGGPPRHVETRDMLQSAGVFLALAGMLGFFVHSRKISLRGLLGLRRLGIFAAGGLGLGLIAAAYPLVMLVGTIINSSLGTEVEPQEVLKSFSEAASRSDRGTILVTLLVAGVIAPVIEEFLFRGYLYGVLKRFSSIPIGMLINATLFAAIHGNLAALAPLFVLAICLTIAYEATGSILVPITMHAVFNLATLVALLVLPQLP